ncbi:RNA polymerase sigma factor [Rossellomorea sp. YZS02]|uniref:RNA polymerase sigma factor n=1 Tax=Rossellomorea sp. YZS02 TaxID=3097358 RepID=UPI002A0CD95B|nr:RNA polymerase sigma factor [Rossellomorea sp. YZS02]MDX8346338.1 RNA polymerase sigma factor [Rossellomorea sp. YZS02]
MYEDQQLIQEILRGSQAAMEVLTRKYYKDVFAFVYRKTGNRDLAYDLTQEIFIKVIKKIGSYSNTGSFKSWVFSVAVNHCRDHWKSAEHQRTQKQSELSEYLTNERTNVSYIFAQKETRERVKMAIGELPEYQRDAIILKYYHEMKIHEIASMTEASESTVKSRLRQGLGKLAKLLGRGEEYGQQQKK